MEDGPGLKMYSLLKMVMFYCYVSLPEGILNSTYAFGSPSWLFLFECFVCKDAIVLVWIYNQQVQATRTLMIFDLQGAFQIPRHLPLNHNFGKKTRVFVD